MPRQRNDPSIIVMSVAVNRQLYNRCLEKTNGNFTLLIELAMSAFLEETLESEIRMQTLLKTKEKLQKEGFAELKRNLAEKEQQKLDVWSKVELENQHKEDIASAVFLVVSKENREKLSNMYGRGSHDIYRFISIIAKNIHSKFPEHDLDYLSNFIIDLLNNNWTLKLKEIPNEYCKAKQEQTV